jgi:hypothetical protein
MRSRILVLRLSLSVTFVALCRHVDVDASWVLPSVLMTDSLFDSRWCIYTPSVSACLDSKNENLACVFHATPHAF